MSVKQNLKQFFDEEKRKRIGFLREQKVLLSEQYKEFGEEFIRSTLNMYLIDLGEFRYEDFTGEKK